MSHPQSPLPRLLTIPEVAGHLRLSTKTIRRLIESGALPSYRLGRLLRIAEPDLRTYLRHSNS